MAYWTLQASWTHTCCFVLQVLIKGLSTEATLHDYEVRLPGSQADKSSLTAGCRSFFMTAGAVQAVLDKLIHNPALQECVKWPLGHRAPGRTWAGLVQALILGFPQACSGGWILPRSPMRMVSMWSTAAAALPKPAALLASPMGASMPGSTDPVMLYLHIQAKAAQLRAPDQPPGSMQVPEMHGQGPQHEKLSIRGGCRPACS